MSKKYRQYYGSEIDKLLDDHKFLRVNKPGFVKNNNDKQPVSNEMCQLILALYT